MKEKGQDKQTKMDQEKFKIENILKKKPLITTIFRETLKDTASIKLRTAHYEKRKNTEKELLDN